ncbi:MAG TPA: DUF4344 domain-containing metallopeptidase [Capillimicrobium sp.]|nr:DUF4344 domain-containing metallopeptidase [Capillimicrobium sp.]
MRSKILLLAVTATTALAAAGPALAADDNGDFQVQWGSLTSRANDNGKFLKANRKAARFLKRSGAMESVVAEVNRRWALPRDIPVLFSDALQAGPAFIPNLRLDDGTKVTFINFPGSFLTLQVQALRPYVRGIDGFDAYDAMVASNEFVIAHEMGHALVRELKIPVTGREEDAVDGFAAYLLADNPKFGPLTALSAAMFFAALTEQRGPLEDTDFADEHSVHEQRVYQFLCWLYGSDPKTFKDLIGRNGLPRARAVRCGAEWKQVNRSWDALLAPYATGARR